jgi:hypothetical protein
MVRIRVGSQDISSPLVFAEGLFAFYKLSFRKRRIFNGMSRIYQKILN